MKKRFFSFLMAVIMLFGVVPVEAFAQSVEEDAGTGMYFIDEFVWLPEGAEPTGEVVETGEWVKTGETDTKTELVCTEAEHTHGESCPTDETGYLCGLNEHQHTETCSVTTTQVKWVVQLKEDAAVTYAEGQGLPIHFFVASPEQASDPEGDYANFKQNLWGRQNGAAGYAYAKEGTEDNTQIHSQQGIRTANDESLITTHVYSWPAGTDSETFKVFDSINIPGEGTYSYADGWRIQWVTICWRQRSGSNYGTWCNCSVSYEHIHIDGILTQTVEPGEMELYKQLTESSSTDQTFTFTLQRLQQNSDYSLPTTEATDTAFAPLTLTATVPANSTDPVEIVGASGAEIGFGYYKLTENTNTNANWRQSGIKIGNQTSATSGPVYIHINTDGSVEYSTSYAVGYRSNTGATFVNSPIPTTEISVTKVWNDDRNRDGIRPASVEVHLLQNNSHYGTPLTLSAANNWTGTWTVPAEDHYGNEIVYHVEETVPTGYTCVVTGNAADGFVLTNTHTPEVTSVQARKVWDDDENRDGVRPESVTIQLYANGNPFGEPAVLSADNSWTKQWFNLSKKQNGRDIQYTVQETSVPAGYTATTKTDETGVLEVINTHELATTSITVTKAWDDNNNQDGARPDSVTLTLYYDGTPLMDKNGNPVTLTITKTSAALSANPKTVTGKEIPLKTTYVASENPNEWKVTIDGLLQHVSGSVAEDIVYSVVEESANVPAGYTVSGPGTAGNGYTVINSRTQYDTVDVAVTKDWQDNNNQDGVRPTELTVTLYANGAATENTLTLNAVNNWHGSFTGLQKNKSGGGAIEYTVRETGYVDAARPDGGTLTLGGNANDGFQDTIPAQAGHATGYTATYSGDMTKGFTITNTHESETVTINAEKIWNDTNNQDGKRPTSVDLHLLTNGAHTDLSTTGDHKQTVNSENKWKAGWTNLPKYHNGQVIDYTVTEGVVVEDNPYSVTYDVADDGTYQVINSYTPEKTAVTVEKIWHDNDDQDGIRPEEIEVGLYIGQEPVKVNGDNYTLTLTEAGNWIGTFSDLDKYANSDGKIVEIQYTVKELSTPAGYEAPEYGKDEISGDIEIINTHEPLTTSVTVTKTWDDNNDQDGKRPDKMTVQLYADGAPYYTTDTEGNPQPVTYELSADDALATDSNIWSHTFTDLPLNSQGTPVVYSVEEVDYTFLESSGERVVTDISGDYTHTIGQPVSPTVGNATIQINLVNKHIPETISIPVTKVWEDNQNQDGIRPVELTITLYADGKAVGEPLILNAGNLGMGSFDNLPKYKAGEVGVEIEYTVAETAYKLTVNGETQNIVNNTIPNPHDTDSNDEEELPGYTGAVTGTAANGFTITNTHTTEKTTVKARKEWDDGDNQDKVRHDSVTFHLLANGVHMGEDYEAILSATSKTDEKWSVRTDEDGNWTVTWNDLDKYSAGDVIDYTVMEAPIYTTDGEGNSVLSEYTASYGRDEDGTVVVTNTYEPETTSITVYKLWDDDNNRDGVRPTSVTVLLQKSTDGGTNWSDVMDGADSMSATLNSSGHWYHTWTGLDLNAGGEKIKYRVVENSYTDATGNHNGLAYGEGSVEYTEDNGVLVVTNSHKLATTSITVTKNWDDNNNQDGARPDSVTLTLYYDGTPLLDKTGNPVTLTITKTSATLSANPQTVTGVEIPLTVTYDTVNSTANSWKVTISGLLQHVSGSVAEDIVYSVVEDTANVPAGYTVSGPGTARNGYTVTNSRTQYDTVDVSVRKDWQDNNNQDGVRPTELTVTLYANGAATENTLTLNAVNNWHGSFTGLQKNNAGGGAIVYTVRETGYVDAARPDGGTLTLGGNANDGFQDTIPAQAGHATGYTATYSGDMTKGFTITNTHESETVTINAEKIWNDNNNQDGKRPTSVDLHLLTNGAHTDLNTEDDHKRTVGSKDEWKATWTGLPKYHNGQEIDYTVTEGVVEDNPYSVTYDVADDGTYQVINSYTPEKTAVTVEKIWHDNDDQDGIRPEQITVGLYIGQEPVKINGQDYTLTLTEAGNWIGTFSDLDKYENGVEIQYTVKEVGEVEGYTTTYDKDEYSGNREIINTHEPLTTSVTVTKTWNDNNDQDGKRPDKMKVQLYADGDPYSTSTVELSEENNWTYTWENLPLNSQGTPVVYSVEEVNYTFIENNVQRVVTDISDDYTHAIGQPASPLVGNTTTQIELVNTHIPETISIPVTKVWEDDSNRDGIRPVELTITLYADGEEKETLILNADNLGMGSFDNLPKYKNGVEIQYTVKETHYKMSADGESSELVNGEIPAQEGRKTGYTASYALATDAQDNPIPNNWIITNTHTPETIDFKAVKHWDDDGDRDGKRPDSITIHLLADSVHMGESYKRVVRAASANENGDWEVTWEDLPKYVAGEQIIYTVYEEITTPQTATDTASEDSGIATQSIEDYTASYKRDSDTQITITNTYEPETTVITAIKVWDDDSNRDGLRPESITVSLLKNGEDTGKILTLSENNDWASSWENLPKYEDHGKKIVYTVKESDVPNGYGEVVHEEEYAPGVFIITNTHDPETTGVTATKIWADENDNDGKRPDGIIVQLYADGSEVAGAQIVLNETNKWSYTWNRVADMPLYVNQTIWNQTDAKYETKQIQYSVAETGYIIDGVEYTGLPEGYTGSTATPEDYKISITNTRATEKISVSVNKQWDDGNNNDGIRPESVAVTLLKNGAVVETVTLNESNQWKHVWTGLYKYAGGVENIYTVEEAAVNGYVATYSDPVKDASGNLTITVINTHAIAEQLFAVQKIWSDNGNQEGLRPNSVTVQIYKNGEAYGDKITLSAANSWKSPMYLPVYENGVAIEWTIKELQIPRYYSASYDQSTMTITNTIQSKEVPKTGDYNNLWLWILLLGGCSAGAAAVVLYGKKRKSYK